MNDTRKEYKVPVVYQMYGTVTVVARDKDNLIKKLNDPDFISCMPLPEHSEYLDDSYEIDFEGLGNYVKD